MKGLVTEWFDKLANAGTLPSDTEDERLCKSILTFAATLIVVLLVFWVTVYAVLGFWVSAAIPLAYQIISVAFLFWFFRTKKYVVFRFSQLTMMLLLPFLLQWSLGGFVVSSGVMLWALIAPLGAVLFQGPKHSVPWFIGYLLLTGASAVADGLLSRNAVPMPPALIVERRGSFSYGVPAHPILRPPPGGGADSLASRAGALRAPATQRAACAYRAATEA